MTANVKLNFRHVPLKLPTVQPKIIVPDIEQPVPSPKREKPKVPKPIPLNTMVSFQQWYYFLPCIFLFYLFLPSRHKTRTLVKLHCGIHRRQLICKGKPEGTFVVEVLEKCSKSIFDVDGVPFHIAYDQQMYRVPAKSLTVKNIDGDCMPKAYLDSNPIEKKVPFSWVTTSQHTWFSITVDGEKVVDKADVLFFKKVEHGNWIAYTFDLDVQGKDVKIRGDGTDEIYIYGV